MTVVFYAFIKPDDIPSPSGYCQKLEAFLRATKTSYELKFTLPFRAPKGKLPYVVIDDTDLVPDSHFIIKHLVRTGKAPDLDRDITLAQRAESRAWQAWVEELIYPCTVLTRWLVPANYAIVNAEAFQSLPWFVRPILGWYMRRMIRKIMHAQGVGRHSMAEVEELLTEYFTSLEARLESVSASKKDKGVAYFHGTEEPTLIDIVVYGFLANALGTTSNPYVNKLIFERPNVRAYAAALTRLWFPEYQSLLKRVE